MAAVLPHLEAASMSMQENDAVSDAVSDAVNSLDIKLFDSDSDAVSDAVSDTPISRPDQYLGSMQVDEDCKRFASSDSCHHDQCRRMVSNGREHPPG